MGMPGPFSRSCSTSPYAASNPSAIAPNPNPGRFEIIDERVIGPYLVLMVNYPDCTNYEGKKLLVYTGWKSSEFLLMHTKGKLDPHFKNDISSPIARFRPTKESYLLIERMAGI